MPGPTVGLLATVQGRHLAHRGGTLHGVIALLPESPFRNKCWWVGRSVD